MTLFQPAGALRPPTPSSSDDAVTMVFEPSSGRVLSASPAAIAWFGTDPVTGPVFDHAMPALQDIAAVAARGMAVGQRVLLFWTPRGPRQLTARLEPTMGPGGAACVLVTTAPPLGETVVDRVRVFERSRERVAPRPSRSADQALANTGPKVRTDTETLREIARRIREGRTECLVDLKRVRAPEASVTPVSIAALPSAPIVMSVAADPIAPPRATADKKAAVAREPSTVEADDKARLAHELRTPLGAISALAEIMRDQRLGPLANARYREYANDIHTSAQHALSVVSAMLAVDATPHRGAAASAPEPLSFIDVDLAAVARESLAILAPTAADAGLTTTLDAADRLPRVVADRRTLKQVLLNLLTNAVRATSRGGSVTIRIGYELAGPVRLEVCDSGIGMTDEQIGRIFSAAPGATERNGERAGFGLPLAIAMADANGAALAIGSTPGVGTRVSLIFDRDRVVPV